MALPPPPFRPQSGRRTALALTVYKRSIDPPMSSPFSSSSACCHHCAVMSPSLSHRKMPPLSPSELPDTTLSSTPTLVAPSSSLPAPSAATLLHHSHCPPLSLRLPGTPHSGEPSPLFGCQTSLPPCRLALRTLHRRPSAAGQPNFTGKSPVPKGEKTSPVSWMYNGIVFGAPTVSPPRHTCGRRH
jgi:hypothetical protein